MKLQVALDYFKLEDAIRLMALIYPYVDIAEIGTPLMLSEGFRAISIMKAIYPHIHILADMKLMDGGEAISSHAFDAGADIATVLGFTNDSTIMGAVRAAKAHGKQVCVDMIGVIDIAKRSEELEALGVDCIAVHTAHDTLGCVSTPIEALKMIRSSIKGTCKAAISGGIKPEAMLEIVAEKPDIVIVGSGLTKAEDPVAVAMKLKSFMG